MKKFGYTQSNSDHTLFLKRVRDKITCLIIYVDDMIITGNDEGEITDLKGKLFKEFEMKDLGTLKYFLGIEVLRSQHGIFIHQRKYILDLLAETRMLDCRPAETPIVTNHGLQTLEGAKLAKKEQYQKIVGKLIYLAHTRPDIAYAVGVVRRFMHLPQVQHMTAVMRILRYLKGTSSTGIYFARNDHLDLIAYTDADWAGDRDGRKSTSGYFTLVGGNLVTWRTKKQKVVALSSVEAEFRGIAKGITEILWIRILMNELGFSQKTTCKLFCDNKAAISISKNPVLELLGIEFGLGIEGVLTSRELFSRAKIELLKKKRSKFRSQRLKVQLALRPMATNVGSVLDQPQSKHETNQVSQNQKKEEGAKRKRMKERSEVWEHFVKEDLPSGRQATCKYYGMSYKCGAKKKRMKEKYEKYWGDPGKINLLIFIDIVLDPYYKLDYVEWMITEIYDPIVASKLVKNVKEALNALYEEYSVSSSNDVNREEVSSSKDDKTPLSPKYKKD
uniref:Reverse transcriptase Ty1/copia-type domain-containing protein n=1 Tax=Chenopodium quinoa TaxID=63459 RepID=A0A803M0S9_CHEQI